MALMRLQTSVEIDSALPRDRMVNVLHFDSEQFDPTDDIGWGTICGDLAQVWEDDWYLSTPAITVSAYAVGSPGPPVATVTRNEGQTPESYPAPREVALCLSYYAGQNTPRRRGRIYLPAGPGGLAMGLRPAAGALTQALDLADSFAGLGGSNIDWVLYSPSDDAHFDVTHAWCDDEWDTMRSRGLRPTTRQSRAVGS